MIHLAVNTEDSLVIDEYYKEGKGINMQLTKYQEAKVQGIETLLTISAENIVLTFTSGAPVSGEALRLKFQHATLEKYDFSVLLTKDAQGNYRAEVDNPTDGKWKVTLQPMSDQWRITQTLSLPRKEAIDFIP